MTASKMPARRRGGVERDKKTSGWVFLSPWIIGFLAFFCYPVLMTVKLSFDGLTSETANLLDFKMMMFTLKNYQKAFLGDVRFVPMILDILKQTVLWTLLITVFSLVIAVLLNLKIKGRAFFRMAFFMPAIIGTGLVAQSILGYSQSVLAGNVPQEFISYLGPEMGILINNLMTDLTKVLMRSSVQVIIFLAGLQGISASLYEAARVDGATPWESFWKITLPMILPTMFINIIYTIIESCMAADNSMVRYLFELTIGGGTSAQYSYGAALSVMYILIVLLVVGAVSAFFSRKTGGVR